jgi:leader peptidase (prepilin peptidase)/N-methyltransferase
VGSFLNVVALRVPAGKSVIHPPSSCSSCGRRLKAIDMIPVLSYLISRGKCRYCGVSYSPLYACGEAATGILYLWIYMRFGWTEETAIGLLLASLSVIVTISDLKFMLIPNKVLLFFAPLFVVMSLLHSDLPIWKHLLGAGVGGGIILLIVLLSRGGMGMGDAKLLALFGWIVGFPYVIMALILASLAGTLVGGTLLLLGIVKRKQPVPFGPFLALGSLITFGYGEQLVRFYLSLFA